MSKRTSECLAFIKSSEENRAHGCCGQRANASTAFIFARRTRTQTEEENFHSKQFGEFELRERGGEEGLGGQTRARDSDTTQVWSGRKGHRGQESGSDAEDSTLAIL